MSGKAESRLVYSSISSSERVGALGAKGALLYTWIIPHCDSQGRMLGSPRVVGQQVVPFIRGISLEEIEESLKQMEAQKLIIWYKDGKGRQLIQIADWWEWQTGLKYKSPSHYEPPKDWPDRITQRDNDGKFVKEDN